MLIKVKMPKIVGILTFMRNINFVPSFEHEKKFYDIGTGVCVFSSLA